MTAIGRAAISTEKRQRTRPFENQIAPAPDRRFSTNLRPHSSRNDYYHEQWIASRDRPRSPHLNGKVERVQKTALEEFWPTVDLGDPELDRLLAEWQHFCNWERPHDSLGGLASLDRVCERIHDVPLGEEIEAAYDLDREFTAPREAWPWRRPN